MSLRRTPNITVDGERFDVELEVCKAEERDGRRFLTGVASGVQEDADGERVSKAGVIDMARQATRGLKLVAGTHKPDWNDEIADVRKLEVDPETDELLIECELPPEGEDPLADKAWNKQVKHGERLGFSVGGKLQRAFFETTDLGKRRKVLDKIALDHVALTKKPSYRQSFSTAVAKTFDADDPADAEFTLDGQDDRIVEKIVVEKAADASSVSQDADTGGSGGEKGKDAPSRDVSGDEEHDAKPAKDLPKADLRRLACPNCGHEFAADMPGDKEPDGTNAGADDDKTTDDKEAGKRAASKEDDMPDVAKALEELRGIVAPDEEPAEKKEPETTGEPVAKTEDLGEVSKQVAGLERMIAASHATNEERVEKLENGLKEALALVAKSHGNLVKVIEELPQGRRSIARVKAQGTPTRHEVEAGDVGKRAAEAADVADEEVAKRIADESDPVAALRLQNAATYGIE